MASFEDLTVFWEALSESVPPAVLIGSLQFICYGYLLASWLKRTQETELMMKTRERSPPKEPVMCESLFFYLSEFTLVFSHCQWAELHSVPFTEISVKTGKNFSIDAIVGPLLKRKS